MDTNLTTSKLPGVSTTKRGYFNLGEAQRAIKAHEEGEQKAQQERATALTAQHNEEKARNIELDTQIVTVALKDRDMPGIKIAALKAYAERHPEIEITGDQRKLLSWVRSIAGHIIYLDSHERDRAEERAMVENVNEILERRVGTYHIVVDEKSTLVVRSNKQRHVHVLNTTGNCSTPAMEKSIASGRYVMVDDLCAGKFSPKNVTHATRDWANNLIHTIHEAMIVEKVADILEGKIGTFHFVFDEKSTLAVRVDRRGCVRVMGATGCLRNKSMQKGIEHGFYVLHKDLCAGTCTRENVPKEFVEWANNLITMIHWFLKKAEK